MLGSGYNRCNSGDSNPVRRTIKEGGDNNMILSINSGSSSLKFMLYSYKDHETVSTGIVERVGMDGSFMEFTKQGKTKGKSEYHSINHEVASEIMIKTMLGPEYGTLDSSDQSKAV